MLFFLIFIFAIFSLLYELLLWTISSYLVWDSILQFSLTIGLFLFWLWIWSYFSKFSKNHIRNLFIWEIFLWFVWWFSVFLVKFLYIYFFNFFFIFYLLYVLLVVFIGFLTWLEVPLIANIINEQKSSKKSNSEFSNIISDVFTYDYIWSLAATFLFPFVLLPWLGITNSSVLLWSLNIIVVILLINLSYVKKKIWSKYLKYTFIWITLLFVYVLLGFFVNKNMEQFRNRFFYKDPIVFQAQSPYQNIVITKNWEDTRLYMDAKLQFSSLDEKRYHEALWNFPRDRVQKSSEKHWKVLVLGWWDGLLIRDILASFQKGQNFKIDLVDLDSFITKQAKENKVLKKLNKNSLSHANVNIINQDAFSFMIRNDQNYDIIIADFPDPRTVWLSKLYSQEFYRMIFSRLSHDWLFVTQAWNAFFANKSFWSIDKTLQSVFWTGNTLAYHAFVPSFGDWWFVLAHKWKHTHKTENKLIQLNFDKDYFENAENIQINTLDNPKIIEYYLEGRRKFNL